MAYSRKDLATFENLELAWKRIQTSTSYEYKKLNEYSFEAFGWNLEKNLKCLSLEILEKIYQPIRASKYYLPKKSGLVRPITILSIKDQIYYQAIVNLICEYKLNDIRKFRGVNIFGGFNIKEPNSIFFLSSWKEEYTLYKESIKSAFEVGYEWLCKFDLASFYDVIDHRILIEVSADGALDDDLKNGFFQALQTWTKPQAINFSHSHGIPQGSVASQVLADIYLHFFDKRVTSLCFKENLKYFRFVDDIFLMSNTEKQAKVNLIKLDIIARELALIPQSGKIKVKKIESIQAELKGENSILNSLEIQFDENDSLNHQEKLFELLLSSVVELAEGKIEITDETNVKYSLNRLEPHSSILRIVVEIAKSYPHLTETCIAYLSKCEFDEPSSQLVLEFIEQEPIFDWHTAKLLQISTKIAQSEKLKLATLSAALLSNSHKHWFLRREAAHVSKELPGIHSLMLEELEKNIINENSFSELPHCLTLLKLSLELDFRATVACFENLVKGFCIPDDLYIFLGYYSAFSMEELPTSLNNHSWVSSNLFTNNNKSIDGISYHLVEFYNLQPDFKFKVDFRDYFEKEEYFEALNHLHKARGLYEKDPDSYFAYTDSFNQILLTCIYLKDDEASISRSQLGNMIGKLKSHIPHAFPGFEKCHTLRCEDPKIHAYNEAKKCLNKNKSKSSRFRERDSLKIMLTSSYETILEYIVIQHITRLKN